MNKKIKITSVSYGRTVSLEKFESARFDFTAEVGPDQTWSEVMAELRTECLKIERQVKKEGY